MAQNLVPAGFEISFAPHQFVILNTVRYCILSSHIHLMNATIFRHPVIPIEENLLIGIYI